jgi:hypothetical protein
VCLFDAVAGNNQTGKSYWQRIEEKKFNSFLGLLAHQRAPIDHYKVIGT